MSTKNVQSKKSKKLVLNKTTVSGFSSIMISNTRTTGTTKSSDFFTCLV
jgi:hypothetical protein